LAKAQTLHNKRNWKSDGLQRTTYYYVIIVFNFFFLLQIIILSNDHDGRWRVALAIFLSTVKIGLPCERDNVIGGQGNLGVMMLL